MTGDKDAGMYDTQVKTVEGAVDGMQFYQNTIWYRPKFLRHEVGRAVALEEDRAKCVEIVPGWCIKGPRWRHVAGTTDPVCYPPDDGTEELKYLNRNWNM